jgi:hypothetical protein
MATVKVVQPSALFAIEAGTFRELLARFPDLRLAIMHIINSRLDVLEQHRPARTDSHHLPPRAFPHAQQAAAAAMAAPAGHGGSHGGASGDGAGDAGGAVTGAPGSYREATLHKELAAEVPALSQLMAALPGAASSVSSDVTSVPAAADPPQPNSKARDRSPRGTLIGSDESVGRSALDGSAHQHPPYAAAIRSMVGKHLSLDRHDPKPPTPPLSPSLKNLIGIPETTEAPPSPISRNSSAGSQMQRTRTAPISIGSARRRPSPGGA